MPANGRWDLIHRLKVNAMDVCGPHHAVMYGQWGTAKLILSLGISWRAVVNFTHQLLYSW